MSPHVYLTAVAVTIEDHNTTSPYLLVWTTLHDTICDILLNPFMFSSMVAHKYQHLPCYGTKQFTV